MDTRERLQRVVSAWVSDVRKAQRSETKKRTAAAAAATKASKASKSKPGPLSSPSYDAPYKSGIKRKRGDNGDTNKGKKNVQPSQTRSLPTPPMSASPTKSGSTSSHQRANRTRSPVKKAIKRRHDPSESSGNTTPFNEEDNEEADDTITENSYTFAISTTSETTFSSTKQRAPSESSASATSDVFRRRSRSNSPVKSSVAGGGIGRTNVRMMRNNLAYATPPIFFGPLERAALRAGTAAYPTDTIDVVRSFSEESIGQGFIPKRLDTPGLRTLSPLETFPPHLFSATPSNDAQRDSVLLRHVLSVYDDAAAAFEQNSDESSWYPVVRSVLKGPDYSLLTSSLDNLLDGLGDPLAAVLPMPAVIDVVEAVTKNLAPKHLPTLPPHLPQIPAFKVDFLLEYNHRSPTVSSFYKKWYEQSSEIATNVDLYYLSPIMDASSVRRVLFCPVEVKPSNGDYAEASLQMGIVAQAAQGKLPLPGDGGGGEGGVEGREWLPTPGLTVVGHSWAFHWTYRDGDGSSRVLGPFNCGDTSSIVGIFKLVNAIEKLKRYAEERYWPWVTGRYGYPAAVGGVA